MKEQLLKNIGIVFCGGCNCYFAREKVCAQLFQQLGERYRVSLWKEEQDRQKNYALTVIINGCSSECMVNEEFQSPVVVINNFNWEDAATLVEEALK